MDTFITALAIIAHSRASMSVAYTLVVLGAIFFGRHRKKLYGTIVDSSTLQPIDQAVVQLLRPDGAVTRSEVTDAQGYFRIIAPGGRFKLSVTKVGYVFPGKRHAGKNSVGHFSNLYHGGEFEVPHKSPLVAPNIFIDPQSPRPMPFVARLDCVMHDVISIAAPAFVAVTAFCVGVLHSPFLAVLAAVEAAGLVVAWSPARFSHNKGWGTVIDHETKRPVRYARIELFDTKRQKMLDFTQTNISGRYSMLVRKSGTFAFRVEKKGFKPHISKTFRVQSILAEPALVAHDIALEPDGTVPVEQRDEVQDFAYADYVVEFVRAQEKLKTAENEKKAAP